MTIRRFEELEVWQEARELCKIIYEITGTGAFAKDFSLKDQIRRASGSIMDNIAEGFGRSGNKEFVNFLSIAMGSANETRSQLYRAFDAGYISDERFSDMLKSTENIHGKGTSLINYLNTCEIKGMKYKGRG